MVADLLCSLAANYAACDHRQEACTRVSLLFEYRSITADDRILRQLQIAYLFFRNQAMQTPSRDETRARGARPTSAARQKVGGLIGPNIERDGTHCAE